MKRIITFGIIATVSVALWGVQLQAQGRGGGIWTTAQNDAARTSWVPTDSLISVESVSNGDLKFLWSRHLETPTGQLTQPVFTAARYITYLGFKGLLYVGGAHDNVYSVDYDLNKPFWNTHLSTETTALPTPGCSTQLTSITRLTSLPGAGGGGRGAESASVYAVSTGGMLHLIHPQTGQDLTMPVRLLPRANGLVTGTIYADNVFYAATSGECGGVPNGVYAMDLTPTPAPDMPEARGPVAPNMTPADTTVHRWVTNGGGVVGPAGLALASDGRAFVATAAGTRSATAMSDAVVALDGHTLEQLDYFSPGDTPFVTSPVVFEMGDRVLVAAANQDGRLYVLDAASLGGADHATPLARSAPYAASQTLMAGSVSTFEADGTRWLLVASGGSLASGAGFSGTNGSVTNGAVLAFKVVDQMGVIGLEPGWASRDLLAPTAPAIVNGVVFALASGQDLSVPSSEGSRGAQNAVLYALDATTGRELWNSGTSIGSFVAGVSPAASEGQVYVAGSDGTLYTFGVEVDR